METITLVLDNRRVAIRNAPPQLIKELESVTSYTVAGHYFSSAFKNGYWDGKEHTMVFRKGEYTIPIGLLGIIIGKLKELNVEYEVKRKKTEEPKRINYVWNRKVKLREYQKDAIKAFCSAPEVGRGILKMPIRSGKTKTAAGIIKRIGVKTLFVVPSTMLMHQTAASLKESLPGTTIGTIGDGGWEEGNITVATVQTLSRLKGGIRTQCAGNGLRDKSGNQIKGKYKPKLAKCGQENCNGSHKYTTKTDKRYKPLINGYGLIIMDECHHLKGESWRGVVLDCQAKYRLGMSATVFFDLTKENETGVIWLRACCGGIKYEVSTSELIDKGYLMRQNVELYAIRKPNLEGEKWSKDLQNQAIYLNEYRNKAIAILAMRKIRLGLNVLIISNRLAQIANISDILSCQKINHVTVTGSDPTHVRDERIEEFKSGNVSIIVGSVFGEGIDIPELECVINAEGGQDVKATIQRMRNMTPSQGKKASILVDFWDTTNKYFKKHSRARAKTYESESAFTVKKMWTQKPKTKSKG